jgi:uncharacterized protein (TIGR02270 family)
MTAPSHTCAQMSGFAPRHISTLVNVEVLAVHVSEAAFLWRQREQAAKSPHFNLVHLSRLDDRLEAHLLALPWGGEEAKSLVQQALGDGEAAAVFVATWLACATGNAATLSRLGAMAGAEASHAAALSAALTWLPAELNEAVVRRLLASTTPIHRVMGLRVLLNRRVQPFGDIAPYLSDSAAPVRALSATLVGVLKRKQDTNAVRALASDTDLDVQVAAARALALLGDSGSMSALVACAGASTAGAEAVAPLMVRCLDLGAARSWIQSLTKSESTLRLGIQVSGMLGDTRVVDWLLALMDNTRYARLAGEAFALMTGADLDPLTLRRDPPEDHDAEADASNDKDVDLGWPDPVKVKQWWMTHRSTMSADRRHLSGRPVSAATATDVIRHGYQRQRAQAAVELALLNRAAMLFPVKAPGPWQRKRLAA